MATKRFSLFDLLQEYRGKYLVEVPKSYEDGLTLPEIIKHIEPGTSDGDNDPGIDVVLADGTEIFFYESAVIAVKDLE
jgi:hypothetical protein